MNNAQVEKELVSLGVPESVFKDPPAPRSYPQHILDGYAQGALLDLRVRFAMQLLTHSPLFSGQAPVVDRNLAKNTPLNIATAALDLACALLALADERGMVTAIDHKAGLPDDLLAQAARIGAFGAFQQIGGQAAMKGAQSAVVPVAPGVRLNG